MSKSREPQRSEPPIDRYARSMGPRITVARETAGMSVEELAAHLGVTPASVTAWEDGERAPRANRLLTIAGVLGTSITWLLEGHEEPRGMQADEPDAEDLRGRVQLARGLIARAMQALDSVEAALEER